LSILINVAYGALESSLSNEPIGVSCSISILDAASEQSLSPQTSVALPSLLGSIEFDGIIHNTW